MGGPLPVSQRCNDKPFSAAQEFILVDKAHICDVDDHLVWVLIEVKTTLLQPLKVVGGFDMEPALEGERVRIMGEEEGKREDVKNRKSKGTIQEAIWGDRKKQEERGK